jgi:hypothetical protein
MDSVMLFCYGAPSTAHHAVDSEPLGKKRSTISQLESATVGDAIYTNNNNYYYYTNNTNKRKKQIVVVVVVVVIIIIIIIHRECCGGRGGECRQTSPQVIITNQ